MSGNKYVKPGERPPGRDDLQLLPHRYQVMFALYCAEQIRDSCKDIPECKAAISCVERWLEGKATAEECATSTSASAAYATNTATNTAAYANAAYATNTATNTAAYSAASAANTAAYATLGLDKEKIIEDQWSYYYELLHFDDIAEKTLLGEVYVR